MNGLNHGDTMLDLSGRSIVFIVVLFLLAISTYSRNIIWKNEIALWKDVARKCIKKGRCLYNIGHAYHKEGHIDEAIKAYRTALRLNPDLPEAYNNLGIAYAKQGQWDIAIKAYLTALRLNPNYADAYNNLGAAYADHGQWDMAIKALKFKLDYAEAHNSLGNIYYAQGMVDDAINEYLAALKLKPDYTEARHNLNSVYKTKKLKDKGGMGLKEP